MTKRKHNNKALKAVHFINLGVNTLSNNGCYDYEKADRKAKSFWYHIEKSKH